MIAGAVSTSVINTAQAAEEECEPEADFTDCVRFTFDGGDQTFTVPDRVTELDVRMWGAGGGGDAEDVTVTRTLAGGGGGYAAGTVEVTGGQELTVTAGEGGVVASTERTYGGGGAGGGGGFPGSSGGGMSALWDGPFGPTPIMIAGGGGGISPGVTPVTQDGVGGGAGGGLEGSWDFNDTTAGVDLSGRPGTQTEGGAAPTDDTGCDPAPMDGSQFQGGDGGTAIGDNFPAEGGGGGGGGFFGGGGGRCQDDGDGQGLPDDPQNGAGGGGSGFIDGPGVTDATTPSQTDVEASNGDLVPVGEDAPSTGAGDPFYTAGIGVGAFRGDGGNGEVVIQWVTPPEATIVKEIDNDSPSIGDTVTYTVTVTNTGEVDFPGASFEDDLSGVVDDAAFNDDAEADVGTVSYEEPTLTWEGDLAVGEAATITYSFMVTSDSGILENAVVAEIEGTNCSAEPAGDGDPADCATTAQFGETLPDTGPGATLALGLVGVGLLLIGGAALVMSRRRTIEA